MVASAYHQTLPVDISLLDGLELAMSEEEQVRITALMTSGDPEQLALAAQIKSGIGGLLKEGVVPSGRTTAHSESMKQLLATSYTNDVAITKALLKNDSAKVHEIRLLEKEVKERRRLHPLPARMPMYACIEPFDAEGTNKGGLIGLVGIPQIGGPVPIGKGPLGRRASPTLMFADDQWDGSLADAFSCISITSKGTIHHTPDDSEGVSHILKTAAKNIQLAPPKQVRVVIRELQNDASKQGFRKGDVVTHVNGKAFEGNSEDLIKLLQSIKEAGREKIQMVVNAELSVAKALLIRAVC